MEIAPSEFRAFVALELMICLLLRTAHSASMDCANYCRHVNSGNIPYQEQMYGACGCDYQPYYSNLMSKYNYAPNYRPSYPMLQVQDLRTTVRTIPFNQQPDGTGIYYFPAEMQWPQNYQNSYINNDFLNPSQIQNRPRGKLVYIPEVSPETNQYSNFDFNIHQTAHIDVRPMFPAEHSTNTMRGNNDNIATRAIPELDDLHHNHQYMDIGFRNLLSKNHGKQNKAKETLYSLNMTANEHHLKNCLEITNLVKSRILHNEDERKGNKTLLHKYKHLSNEAVSEEISKSCQHSSEVIEKDIKTIKTFKRHKAKIVNKEDIMDKPTKPPLRSHTAIPDESDSLHILENTTNEPKSIIEDRQENGIVESSTESIKEFDKGTLRNEGNKIEENDVKISPTDLNEIERMDSSTSTESPGEEVTDGAKNMHTSCTVNDNTNLKNIFNETASSNKIDTDHQNYTTVKYGDIKHNDTIHVNMTQKGKDYEEKAKKIGRNDNLKIKDTASTNIPTEFNDSHIGVTMATDEEGNTSIMEINNNVKVNNTHMNTTMATDEEVNTRVIRIHDSVKVNDTHVKSKIATNEEEDTREMGINNILKINSTIINDNIITNEEGNKRLIGINNILTINDTHINAAMATDNVGNASVTEIDEVNVNQEKATTIASNSKETDGINVNIDNVHTITETALPNLKLERSEATDVTTTPLMEIYEPDIYTSNETDRSDENNVAILKVNPNEMKTSEDVNDEQFKHPQNKSEKIDKFDTQLGTQNETEVVKEIDESAIINEIRINKTAKTTDEVNPALMGFNDIIISTTPIMESTDPDEINNRDENDEVLMKINSKNSKDVNDKNLELSQNKTEGVNDVNDSATTNDHINIKTKTTDEDPPLTGIDNVIVTTIPVTDIPKLSTSNGTDISDENNEVIIKANPKKTKLSEGFNDKKIKNSQNHTAGTKEFVIRDLNKTTKAINEDEKNLEFDDANTTITPTIDINEIHETQSSNENNEVILKVTPKKSKTSNDINDEKLRLPEDKSERTEEFDDSLLATPSTERSVNSFTSNKNERDTAMDDATKKTAANLKMIDKSVLININPTVSSMETEATQSLADVNSTVSRNETVDSKVIPINKSSEQHVITESGNNDSAKILDASFEDSDKNTLPPFSSRMKVGKNSKKSKLGIELVTNKLTGEVGANIPTIPSIEPSSTEPTKTTMAVSNDWATKPGDDGLNSLVKIRTIHHNKKGKTKNRSPETEKDKLILVKMLPPDSIQDNNRNDMSETKVPDLNNDESSQFAISTFETPYDMITNTDGRDEDLNKIPSNLSFRRLPHRKNMKSEFNEEQKLLQNSFPNTTNSNHTIQSTKRHTTIVADSQENVNSGQYVATTNNPIKNANKDNRRRINETHDKVTPDQKRIPDSERIVSNIVTKETNKGIVTSMKDELVSNEELQGGKTDGETGPTLPSIYMDESVTALGEYPDDIPIQYNGNTRRNMNNKEVVGEDKFRDILDDKPNTLNQNITLEYLPAELRDPDNESLSGLPQETQSSDSLYTQPILNGKMYFVQNGTNLIPLKFIQKPNGNIALGIDGNFICENLLSSLNETSVLLSVLCNKKITNDHVPKNNYTLATLPETST